MGGISSNEPDFARKHTREVLDDGTCSKILKSKGSWFLCQSVKEPAKLSIVKRTTRRRESGWVYVDFFDLREGPYETSGLPLDWTKLPGVQLDGYAQDAIKREIEARATVEKMKALTEQAIAAPTPEARPYVELRRGEGRSEERYAGTVTGYPARGGIVVRTPTPKGIKVLRFVAANGWRFATEPKPLTPELV